MSIEQSELWQTGQKYLDMNLINNETNEWAELALEGQSTQDLGLDSKNYNNYY